MILTLDVCGSTPLYQQLRDQIVTGIARGDLRPGESLPTVRQLAQDAGINTMTVNKAYQLLKAEGYILIDRRHGAAVAPPRDNAAACCAELTPKLTLLTAEARLNGVNKAEFLALCERLFPCVEPPCPQPGEV